MNPFILSPYQGEKWFCDRREDTKSLLAAIKSRRNVTLYSIRRMGKTGLIMHVHQRLPKSYIPIYIDVLNTSSDDDFARKFISATLTQLEKRRKSLLKEIIEVFSRFKISFTFDPVSGLPAARVEIRGPEEVRMSMDLLFQIIRRSNYKFQFAIDEFQQIANYERTIIDATLREAIQTLPNAHFIFCGSQRHLLIDLFAQAKNPLFKTTQFYRLHKINYPAYFSFIKNHFEENDRVISDQAIHHILTWTNSHTFYTQFFCNRLFELATKEVEDRHLRKVKDLLYREHEISFYAFKNLLSSHQWGLIRAIAKENELRQPTSDRIRSQYGLGGVSTISRALNALLDKEMIFEQITNGEKVYAVYDVFFSRWLQEVQ